MGIGHLQAVGMIRTRKGKDVTELGQGDPRLHSPTAAAGVKAHGRTTAGATVPATNPQLPNAADALCCAHHAPPMRFYILCADIGIYGVLMTGYTCIFFFFLVSCAFVLMWHELPADLGVEAETGELQ